MKTLQKLTLFVLMIVILSFGVSAQLQVPDVKLGSDTQDRARSVSKIVTVTNTGNDTITGLTVSFPGANSKYQISGNLSDTTLDAGDSTDLVVNGYVPLDLDAVDSRGRKITLDIGNVVVEGDENGDTVSGQGNLLMEAENQLEFGSGTEVDVDGDTEDLDDGDDINDVKRGSRLDFTIEVENNFDDDGDCEVDGDDCDIENVEVIIESRDSELDLDEDLDFNDMRARDEDTESFTFTVDDDVDDDDYDIEMWVTGRDENGARHGEYWEFTIEVEVPREEVLVDSFDLFPSTLSCNRETTLTVTLENSGRNDLEDASIFIESAKLDIKDSIYHIDLDEGDSATRTFNLQIPEDLNPGRYFIQIIGNVDNSEETDRDAATLTIEECQPEEEEPPEEDDDDDGINVIDVPPTSGVIYGEPKDTNFFNSSAYVLMLAVLAFIALLLLVLLLAVLLK